MTAMHGSLKINVNQFIMGINMKRIKLSIILLMMMIASILCNSCSYCGWQKIDVAGIGTFKVPQGWIYTQEENVGYFTDKPIYEKTFRIYLIGTINNDHIGGDYKAPYELFDNTEYSALISSAVFSNSAIYGQEEYIVDNSKQTKFFISLNGSNKSLDLLAWDDLVYENTVIKIAKSFLMELND